MGSGKSFIGYSLAQKLHLPFIDLDKEIEKSTGCTISDFFRIHGEAEFRKEEKRLLREQGSHQAGFIMATGGGTPCFHDNMQWMNETGTTLYLRVSLKTLVKRLSADKQNRPLLASLPDEELLEGINSLFRERECFYKMSSIQMNAGSLSPDILVGKIAATLIP